MNLFVQPKSNQIYTDDVYNYGNWRLSLVKDTNTIRPTATLAIWSLVLIIVLAAVFDPFALIFIPLLILPASFTLKMCTDNFSWYAFKRKQETIAVDNDWQRMSIRYEENPVVQQAMEDLWAEKQLLGEFFDPEPWRDQFREINKELDRQKELEKKQALELASGFKVDYAKTIRETNEIMNKSLE